VQLLCNGLCSSLELKGFSVLFFQLPLEKVGSLTFPSGILGISPMTPAKSGPGLATGAKLKILQIDKIYLERTLIHSFMQKTRGKVGEIFLPPY